MLDSRVLQIVCDESLKLEIEADTMAELPNWEWYEVHRGLRFFRKLCQEGRERLETLCNEFRRLEGSPNLSPLRAVEALLWWEMIRDIRRSRKSLHTEQNIG
jgi:hypothetical protein